MLCNITFKFLWFSGTYCVFHGPLFQFMISYAFHLVYSSVLQFRQLVLSLSAEKET